MLGQQEHVCCQETLPRPSVGPHCARPSNWFDTPFPLEFSGWEQHSNLSGASVGSAHPHIFAVRGPDRRPVLLLLRDAPPFCHLGGDIQQALSFEVLPGLFSLTFKFAFNTTNFMCYFYLFLPFETGHPVLTLMA